MTDTLFAVMGPTCSGKTSLAIEIAERIDGEIVSCDSAAVFIGLDVGTAKPTKAEQARVRHHVIDTLDPKDQWSGADYAAAADAAIADIRGRNKVPILCGGTGLWMRALVHGFFEAPEIDETIREAVRAELVAKGAPAMHDELATVDPIAAGRIERNDPQRIGRALEVYRQTGTPISTFQAAHGFAEQRYRLIGVAPDVERDELRARIAVRTDRMYDGGILDETRDALAAGVPADSPGLSIIGYRDAVRVVRGQISEAAAREETTTQTRRYAKRQRNWFNKEPAVVWTKAPDPDEVLARLYQRQNAGVDDAER